MAPMPSPVKKRSAISCVASAAAAEASIPAVTAASDHSVMRRRPNPSDSGARNSEPKAMPMGLAESSRPVIVSLTPQSLATKGAANDITSTS